MRSGSPPFDNSNTATNSESGNGGSNSRGGQNKTTGTKEVNENNSTGDSGENVYSGGTGTGTSGGVSAVANAHHKRIHNRTYGQSASGGSADNVSGYMGGSGVDPWSSYYKSPLLTEQLLLAHNRGMEKEMIDSYKEGRKGDLKFLKNRMKTAKAAHQAMKRTHHNSWKAVHEKVHKQLPGPVGVSGVDPQASNIQL